MPPALAQQLLEVHKDSHADVSKSLQRRPTTAHPPPPPQVDAVRQARLEAANSHARLEDAHVELVALRHQVAELAAQQQGQAATPAAATLEAALQEARLDAVDARCKARLAELELAKQLDALQELQWQLDCVVAQLGLAPDAAASAAVPPAAGPAAPTLPGVPSSHVDHMLLLSKVEELRCAQLELGECHRRLAATEAVLAAARADPAGAPAAVADLGPAGRQLVGELLAENEHLRRALCSSEDQYEALQRDYEVELLLSAEAKEAAAADAPQQGWAAGLNAAHPQLLQVPGSGLQRQPAAPQARAGSEGGSPLCGGGRTPGGPPVSPSAKRAVSACPACMRLHALLLANPPPPQPSTVLDPTAGLPAPGVAAGGARRAAGQAAGGGAGPRGQAD